MKMTEGELYDNLNGASFSTLVCQKDIPTDKDVVELHGKGYGAAISAKQFSEMLPLLPMDKFFYGPSLTLLSLYFNPETLTAVPVFIPQLLLLPTPEREKKQMLVLEEIERVEKKMCDGDYRPNLQVFPNGMRLEYIEMLSKKIDIPNLYDTFFSTYRSVDFGFSAVSPRFLQQVLRQGKEMGLGISCGRGLGGMMSLTSSRSNGLNGKSSLIQHRRVFPLKTSLTSRVYLIWTRCFLLLHQHSIGIGKNYTAWTLRRSLVSMG